MFERSPLDRTRRGADDLVDVAAPTRAIGLATLLRRRKETVGAIVAIGVGASAAVGFARPAIYTAEALAPLEAVETHDAEIALLRSPSFVETLIERIEPERILAAAGETSANAPPSIAGAIGALDRFTPSAWRSISPEAEPNADAEHANALRDRAARVASRALSVERKDDSSLISIAYSATDPKQAAELANAIAEIHLEHRHARAVSALEARIAKLDERARAAEQALAHHRARNDPSAEAPRSAASSEAWERARGELAHKEARASYLRGLLARGEGIERLNDGLTSPLLGALWRRRAALEREELEARALRGANHPATLEIAENAARVSRAIRGEIEDALARLDAEIAPLAAREAALRREVEQSREAADGRALERRAETARALHVAALARLERSGGSASLAARAEPPRVPSSPSPLTFLAVGFVASSIAGVGFAWLREKADDRVRGGEEIERRFGVPVLGQIPKLGRRALRDGRRPHGYLASKPLSTYAEAVRATIAALRRARTEEPKVVQVTSSAPDEGKTTLAVSLAAALAQDGAHVCLIDLDLRRPTVRREIELPFAGALLDYMKGAKTFEELAQFDKRSGIDVIAADRTPPDPARLLASQRMADLIDALRARYDYVVIDSAPILGVADGKEATALADAVLFAARWGGTRSQTLGEALDALDAFGGAADGVVITQIDRARHARGGYGGAAEHWSAFESYYVD